MTERKDTPERPWETCNACNYDKHVCKGCGEPTTHAQGFVCPACSEECKHEMVKMGCAECRGLTEPNPLEGLLIDRFYTAARYQQPCQMSFNGLQRHDIEEGEPFGMAVHDNKNSRPPFKRLGYVCGECMHRIADGVSVQ